MEHAAKSLAPGDAAPRPEDGNGCKDLAAARGIEHFVVGGEPGARVASGRHHIQNVNSLHARYDGLIKPFRGPAAKNLDGCIRRLEARLAGGPPADVIRAA